MYTQYRKLLSQLLKSKVIETNKRTGVVIKALGMPCSIALDLRAGFLPLPCNRRVYPSTAAAELAWQLSGTRSLAWLIKHCAIWTKFADIVTDDGEPGLSTAYGYRWRHAFGRDQIAETLNALSEDSTNRQIYISAWDPAVDGLGSKGPSNIPCPVGFSLNVTAGVLNCAVFIRSSDVFVGLPYDVMNYALLVDAFAQSLNLIPGFLHVTLAHPHLYEKHFEMAEGSLNKTVIARPVLPGFSIEEIVKNPDYYVKKVADTYSVMRQHPYSVRPEVVL